MEPKIQVISDMPFQEQIVGLFGDEKAYTQFSANGVNILAMAVCCIKSVVLGMEGEGAAEELYAVVGAMSIVLMNWIIMTRADDEDHSLKRARKIEEKMIDRIITIPVEELILNNPVDLMKLLIGIAGIVGDEVK